MKHNKQQADSDIGTTGRNVERTGSKLSRAQWVTLLGTGIALAVYLGLSQWLGQLALAAHFVHNTHAVVVFNSAQGAATLGLVVSIYLLQHRFLVRPLRWAAQHDALTGLLNQGTFWETVRQLKLPRADSVTVMVADVDHFKTINDTWGHLVGDQVLAHIGGTLRQNIRAGDIVGRIGGEEFGAIWIGVPEPTIRAIAERWRMSVENLPFADPGLAVTISIGIASNTSSSLPQLLDVVRQADRALYEAKASGRNRIVTKALGRESG